MTIDFKPKQNSSGGINFTPSPAAPAGPTFNVPQSPAQASAKRLSNAQEDQVPIDKEAGKSFFTRFRQKLGENLIPSEIGLGKTLAGIAFQGSKTDRGLQDSITTGFDTQTNLLKQIRDNDSKGIDSSRLKQLYNDGESRLNKTTKTARDLVQLPTQTQVAGQLGGTALDLLTAGTFNRAKTAAMGVGKLAPGLTGSPVKALATGVGLPELGAISGQKAGGLFSARGVGNIATGAGIGYASDVSLGAQGLRGEDRDGMEALIPGLGTLIGGSIPVLSEAGATVKNFKTGEARTISKRQKAFTDLRSKSVPIDNIFKQAEKRGVDAQKVLSETNLLNGAMTPDGRIDATQALLNIDDFASEYMGQVRKALAEEGSSLNLNRLVNDAVTFVDDSRLIPSQKAELQREIAKQFDSFNQFLGDNVPLSTIHDTKIVLGSRNNYLNPSSDIIDKEAARFFKELVEKNSSIMDVKGFNTELSRILALKDVVEKLDKKVVSGGRLGKYFSQTIGTMVGGLAGGPIGAIMGAEAGSMIKGGQLSRALGGDIQKGLSASQAMLDATAPKAVGKAAIQDVVLPKNPKTGVLDLGKKPNQSNILGSRKTSQSKTTIPIKTVISENPTPKAVKSQVGINLGKKAEVPKFKNDTTLSTANSKVEKAAFAKITANEAKLLADYKVKHGKVINTDSFRPFFSDVGYVGHNAAAVQEPSSYLSKKAYTEALKNPQPVVSFMAGGSGTGKTSAIKDIPRLSKIQKNSAAIVDSNLSSYDSAIGKIFEAHKAKKRVIIDFVYRDPFDSFENGVIKRMIDNPDEMGRLVPAKVVAANHIDSFDVVRKLQDLGVTVNYIDNSLGAGKAAEVDRKYMDAKVKYPSKEELTEKFKAIAKRLLDEGKITKEQYGGYIE